MATLALGIGVNVTAYTLMNAILVKGFPFVAGSDRILYITSRDRGCCVSYPDFEDWRAQAKSFQGMAVVHGVGIVLRDKSGFPESFGATEVSANTFQLIGQRPTLGRDFAPSDEAPGAAPVAILSYGLWERRFGKDPGILGHSLRVSGVSGNGTSAAGAPITVIGVMPRGFSFPQNQDLWLPLMRTPGLEKRDARVLWFAFGRLAEGVSIRRARVEMEMIGKRLAGAYPATNQGNPPVVQTFEEFAIGPNARLIYGSMWGAVGFVLLIACANLANLMLARAMGRTREISVRIALGAGRRRIIRQILIESLLLSALGGFLGWWIAKWGVHNYATAAFADWKQPWFDFSLDYRALGYLVAISIGTALLFGLAPASRLSNLDLNETLKDGARGATTGRRGRRVSFALVAAEMALAIVLLAGAGVTIRSFLNVYTADLGIKSANLLMIGVGLPVDRYATTEAQLSFFDRLKKRIEAIPGVESASLAYRLPTQGSLKLPYEIADAALTPRSADEQAPTLSALIVDPGYFRTMGAAILSGRDFNDFDAAAGIPVTIINQWFAADHWPGQNPLGKRIRLSHGTAPGSWLTVVGVASNIVQTSMARQQFDPLIYLPYPQNPKTSMYVLARTRIPPASLETIARREVGRLDPDLPIWGPLSLARVLKVWNYQESASVAVLAFILAAIALLLASVGLYAVVANSVSRRTQEIGIRMAAGATARDVLKLVFWQAMLPLWLGLAIGVAASFAVNRLLQASLVRVSPTDPITLLAASATLVLFAAAGCFIPARRAMRVDPVVALRHE